MSILSRVGWRWGWGVITVYMDFVGGGKLRETVAPVGRGGWLKDRFRRFTKKHYFSFGFFSPLFLPFLLLPPFPLSTCFSRLLPPSQFLCSSFVLQGLRLDVIGDPSGSWQGQDGVVNGSHFHSQRDGVLVLTVRCTVILKQGGKRGKATVKRRKTTTAFTMCDKRRNGNSTFLHRVRFPSSFILLLNFSYHADHWHK